VRLLTTDDHLLQVLTNQGPNGQFLWLGAEVDIDDRGVTWPGRVAIGNAFVPVPDDRIPQIMLQAGLGGGVQ
jgi:hypothetical protein